MRMRCLSALLLDASQQARQRGCTGISKGSAGDGAGSSPTDRRRPPWSTRSAPRMHARPRARRAAASPPAHDAGRAPRRYALEPDALRLGVLPYAQAADAEVLLVNAGAVPFDFTAAVEPGQEPPGAAACGACAVSPARGHVPAFGRAPLRVRVSPMSYAPTPDPHPHG
jgi:hypothetical protein